MDAPTRNQFLAYNIFRAFVGLDFFGHGYARIFTGSYLPGFAESMQKSMASAPLAPSLVLAMGYVIPVVELIAGTLLLIGLFTRWALYLAFALMFALMFGVTMKQDWNAAGQQLLYGFALFVLLFLRNRYNASWLTVLRSSDESPRPMAVVARPRPFSAEEPSSPLGRS